LTDSPLVLVADQETSIRRLLQATLTGAGYRVRQAATGGELLGQMSVEDPSVILLDLGLPDCEGLELLPILEQRSKAAVLVISARDATGQKVAALDLGASDYVTKPFDTDELLARVRAAMRARLSAGGGKIIVAAHNVIMDFLGWRITRNGVEVHLTVKEFRVVAELGRFPGRTISHRQLLRAACPGQSDPHIEYLRVAIHNIRQKLETNPATPHVIVTELNVGYRLVGESAESKT
jgi:two-component system KDP operon response regulator KdpE